jgi:hypothetical protein
MHIQGSVLSEITKLKYCIGKIMFILIHAKYRHTLRGQNLLFLMLHLVIWTTANGLQMVNLSSWYLLSGKPSHPGHFTTKARVPGTHWTGGWVRPQGSRHSNKETCTCTSWETDPSHPAQQQSLTDSVANIFGPVDAMGKTDTIQYCSTACDYS